MLFKIRRQDDSSDIPYWEEFSIECGEGMTVLDALVAIGERPVTSEGNLTAPIAHDACCCTGCCGSCVMLINGRARLACRTFLCDLEEPVSLEALSKFPRIRDLRIDRGRMFESLAASEAWVALDGVHAHGPMLRASPQGARDAAPYAACIVCGACSEACPQVNERTSFPGAFLLCNLLPLMDHPLGRFEAPSRLDAILLRGGIADCAGAGACEDVCPKDIPLKPGIARLQAMAGRHAIRRLLRG